IPDDTDIYAFFDTTSMIKSDGVYAKKKLQEWFSSLKARKTALKGNLYIIPYGYVQSGANSSEQWLKYPNVVLNGPDPQSILLWKDVAEYPPNFDNSGYAPSKNVIILSFIDEVYTSYHDRSNSFLGQPTQEYISDLNQFISDYNKFDSFKDVLYPIPRMSNNDTTTSLLQMVGALYGRTLSQSEIDSLGSYVDLSLLKTENPYSNLTPLKDLGFLGVFNKKSPASDVFSQETFSEEIEDLLSLDSFYSTYEEIPVEKQKKKVVAYKEISTDNKEYFDNYSFTLSYSFLLNSWVSYHSYLPLYYIEANNHFYSGVNDEIWEHTNNIKYNNFYGKIFPYIIEFPYFYKYNDEILQYIEDYTKVYKPLSKSDNDFIKVEDKYFDKAVIFNDVQNSGYLNLKKKPDHD